MTPPDDTPDKPAGETGGRRDIARTLDPDYEAILAAVTETARGRWFLDEYARRNRTADTKTLLSAMNRLQKTIARQPTLPARSAAPPAELMTQLTDLAEIVGRARIEIAAVPRYDNEGSVRRTAGEIDLLTESESGKSAVLQAHESAERIQEVVWNLRERNVSSDLCDVIDRHAVDIQAACRSGTATLKGMDAMGRGLHQFEARIGDLIQTLSAMPAETDPVDDVPDIFLDDPALGRFIEDIEIIDVEDVNWHEGLLDEDEPAGDDDTDLFEPEEPDRKAAPATGDVIFDDEDDMAPAPLPNDAGYDLEPSHSEETVIFGGDAGEIEDAGPAAKPVREKPVPETPATAARGSVVQPIAESAKPSQQERGEPPADLTGLTFDQKMILFS
jgi:hypothetical protein